MTKDTLKLKYRMILNNVLIFKLGQFEKISIITTIAVRNTTLYKGEP